MARPSEGKTNRIHIALTDEEMREIDDYRYGERKPTRSEAIRALLKLGLDQWRKG